MRHFSQDLHIFLLLTVKWIDDKGIQGNFLLSSNYLGCRKFSTFACSPVVKLSPSPFPLVITSDA